MDYTLYREEGNKSKRIFVEAATSKSYNSRLLCLNFLSRYEARLHYESGCDDIWALKRAISQMNSGGFCDVGESGTAYRFVTALAAATPGAEVTLVGAHRLTERPIMPLVEALRSLGADIDYDLGCVGKRLPVIRGKQLAGGRVEIDATLSSQFISALMLIGPRCKEPLQIVLRGKPVSTAYLNLTMQMMACYHVEAHYEGNVITIPSKDYYAPKDVNIPNDWVAITYLLIPFMTGDYHPEVELCIYGPTDTFESGDARCMEWFREYGLTKSESFVRGDIVTSFRYSKEERENIEREYREKGVKEIDFSDVPDLVPSMAMFYCLKGRRFRFTGVHHLRLKESDRLATVCANLRALGYVAEADDDTLEWKGETVTPSQEPVIESFGDHRLVMAFCAGAQPGRPLLIRGANHVTKSFPSFFRQLHRLGFVTS